MAPRVSGRIRDGWAAWPERTQRSHPSVRREALPGLIPWLWASNVFEVRGNWPNDAVILGGCGHVGLPLGLALADAGLRVSLFDTNTAAVRTVLSGSMPHREAGAQEVLERTLASGNLTASSEPSSVASAECLIVVIGTPVDEHLNPDPQAVVNAVESVEEHLRDGQLLVLRSTIFPGVTRMVERLVERMGKSIDVAFCPERIAEGRAMRGASLPAADRFGTYGSRLGARRRGLCQDRQHDRPGPTRRS